MSAGPRSSSAVRSPSPPSDVPVLGFVRSWTRGSRCSSFSARAGAIGLVHTEWIDVKCQGVDPGRVTPNAQTGPCSPRDPKRFEGRPRRSRPSQALPYVRRLPPNSDRTRGSTCARRRPRRLIEPLDRLAEAGDHPSEGVGGERSRLPRNPPRRRPRVVAGSSRASGCGGRRPASLGLALEGALRRGRAEHRRCTTGTAGPASRHEATSVPGGATKCWQNCRYATHGRPSGRISNDVVSRNCGRPLWNVRLYAVASRSDIPWSRRDPGCEALPRPHLAAC